MKRVITTLLLVTLIQCALVAIVYWPQQMDTSQSVKPVWETLTAAAIDEIRIVDEQGQEQLLQKNGEHWQLPGQHTLPVDPERIEKLLARSFIPPGWLAGGTLSGGPPAL